MMPQKSSTVVARPPARRPLGALIGLPLAVVCGLLIPVQSRVNGALGAKLDDGLAAAVISFTTGLVVLIALSALLPGGRAGVRAVAPAIRARKFPLWYLLAGAVGAFFVLTQGVTISVIGVALFTVSTVTGQTISGLLVDRWGLGPAGRKTINGMRVLGALLTVAAVVWAVSPRLGSTPDPGTLMLALIMPVAAGLLMSFQQAMNGVQAVAYGTPLTATLTNFATGAVVLWIAWLIKLALGSSPHALPDHWWYFIGGPLGCIYIGVSAVLVRGLGVLLTGLGLIAGQLLGSLALDVFIPAPGTVVALATVLGTVLTLLAITVATLPWPRKFLR